jgi:hypothetical protein
VSPTLGRTIVRGAKRWQLRGEDRLHPRVALAQGLREIGLGSLGAAALPVAPDRVVIG